MTVYDNGNKGVHYCVRGLHMLRCFSSANGLLSIVLLIVSGLLLPAVGAEDWEHAYVTKVDGVTYVHADVQLYVEPEAVEAGQQVRVNVKVRPPPPVSEVFRDIRVRVLYPNGRSEFHGPFNSFPNGSLSYYFMPALNGIYTLQLDFPSQVFADNTLIYVGYRSETTLKVLPLPATPPYESVVLWAERAPMRVARGGLRAAGCGRKNIRHRRLQR